DELGDRVRDRTSELVEGQELARIGRWDWDLATGTVTWSDEMFRIHGALPGAYEVSFEKAVELIAPEDRQRIEENIRSALGDAPRYRPAETGLSAGGDWYVVVPLPDGSVSVVIGDVAGHGLEAASVMGQLRLAVRAYALEGRPPASVVALADGLLSEVASDVM